MFCGEGGASQGYANAGFVVEGVDIKPMRRYPFVFHLGDALEFARDNADRFDCFHASPPCQAHTIAKTIHGNAHECFIQRTREFLNSTGKPYVIENVPLAPLHDPIELSGKTFGLRVIRRRLFESNFWIEEPPREVYPPGCTNAHRGLSTGGEYICVAGHNFLVAEGREAMQMHWASRDGLAQAIPPAYTQYVAAYMKLRLNTKSPRDASDRYDCWPNYAADGPFPDK